MIDKLWLLCWLVTISYLQAPNHHTVFTLSVSGGHHPPKCTDCSSVRDLHCSAVHCQGYFFVSSQQIHNTMWREHSTVVPPLDLQVEENWLQLSLALWCGITDICKSKTPKGAWSTFNMVTHMFSFAWSYIFIFACLFCIIRSLH